MGTGTGTGSAVVSCHECELFAINKNIRNSEEDFKLTCFRMGFKSANRYGICAIVLSFVCDKASSERASGRRISQVSSATVAKDTRASLASILTDTV